MKKLTTIIIFLILMQSTQHSSAQSWSLNGNAGTNPTTQFLGTTDNKALKIRTNNNVRITVTSGGKVGIGTSSPVFKLDVKGGSINTDSVYRIGGITVLSVKGGANTFTGAGAGISNTTGYNNTANGADALRSNTTGNYNTANGAYALSYNTTGEANTADGEAALRFNTTGINNTANGAVALFYNTTGTNNTANGAYALYSNTTGSYNSVNGSYALHLNATGYENTANGYSALYSNTSGSYNSATGFNALKSNSTANYNTANGHSALYNNSTGTYNSAFGAYSLYVNSTGSYNTASGVSALHNNTIGSYNTANGYQALYSHTQGYYNTASGYQALYANTTGSYNTADGGFALENNTSGAFNTALGYYSLNLNTGSRNTAVGYVSLTNTTTAEYNTAVGYNAGSLWNNGYNNVFVGASTSTNGADYYNVIALGQGTTCTAVNQARFGNSATTSYGGWAGWSNVSDGRFKKSIKENVPGIEFINKLRPVTYTLAATELDAFLHEKAPLDMSDEGKKIYNTALKQKEQITYTGFIAQEVEAAAKDLGFDFSGVDAAKNQDDVYGLRYAEFVVPLVKAVQELDTENGKLKIENSELKSEVNSQRSDIETLKSEIQLIKSAIGQEPSGMTDDFQKLSGSSFGKLESVATLGQNIPNPFDNSTLIPFRIPKNCNDASIMIMNTSTSAVISVIPVSCNEDHVSIDAGTLTSGTYSYALFVDGKLIDKKKMVITK